MDDTNTFEQWKKNYLEAGAPGYATEAARVKALTEWTARLNLQRESVKTAHMVGG